MVVGVGVVQPPGGTITGLLCPHQGTVKYNTISALYVCISLHKDGYCNEMELLTLVLIV